MTRKTLNFSVPDHEPMTQRSRRCNGTARSNQPGSATAAPHTLGTALVRVLASLLPSGPHCSTAPGPASVNLRSAACQLTRACAPILAQTHPWSAWPSRVGWCRWSALTGGHLRHIPPTLIELGVRELSETCEQKQASKKEFTSDMWRSADGSAGHGRRERLPTTMGFLHSAPFTTSVESRLSALVVCHAATCAEN
jgi:hypothetical protein